MGRSNLFRRLSRTLKIAQWSTERGIPADEALEIDARARGLKGMDRREFLRAAGSTFAVGALGAWASTQQGCAQDDQLGEPRPRLSGLQLPDADIAVVGAGLAGLSCARELDRWGLVPTVYEAADHIGGRCWSLHDYFPGQVVERGGELIDTTHTTMRGYAREFGLSVENLERFPGESFYYFGGQHYDEAAVVEEYRALVPAMQADIRQLGSPTADSFTEYDRLLDFTDLRSYLTSRGAGDLIKAVLDVTYNIEYGLEIDRQSCLNLLFFIHADRRSKWTPFGVFSDEVYHVVEGNQAIPLALAASLPRPVTMDHRLVAARRTPGGRVELTFKVGRSTVTRVHDAVVLTLPFSVLRNVDLDPSLGLPDWKRHAIDNLGYGTNTKLMLGFQGPFWRDLGSAGDTYSDQRHHQNAWETNPSRATADFAVMTDYSGGNLGASLSPRRDQRDAQNFLNDLENILPGANAAAVRDATGDLLIHMEHWPSNPNSLGSYTCNQPGYFTTIAGNEAKPVGNLFFAGEHTDSFYEWQGFMEGACNSGLRAASEVIDSLR